jgi:hypothetical protein
MQRCTPQLLHTLTLQDNLIRTIPSNVANAIISRVTGVHLHDTGCTLKVWMHSWSQSVDSWSQGVDSWSQGVDAWSQGVDAWSQGVDAWSQGVDAWFQVWRTALAKLIRPYGEQHRMLPVLAAMEVRTSLLCSGCTVFDIFSCSINTSSAFVINMFNIKFVF